MKIKTLPIIGWREWVELPDLGKFEIKVKVDSGARSSSLHAYDLNYYKSHGHQFVKFDLHPDQRSTKKTVTCKAKVLEFRKVKSSNGLVELRPVIETKIRLMEQEWVIEVTLTNRDEMGFRMLLGRESFKNKFLLDAGKSFYSPSKKRRKS